jgi:YHS domain-containing protein
MVKDPVCEMQVLPEQAPAKSVYHGQTYYFCSSLCKHMFDRQPEKYMTDSVKEPDHPKHP